MLVFLIAVLLWFLYSLIAPFFKCCAKCSKYANRYSETENASFDLYQNISSVQLINEYEEIDGQITHFQKIEKNQASIKALDTPFLTKKETSDYIDNCCKPKLKTLNDRIREMCLYEIEHGKLELEKEDIQEASIKDELIPELLRLEASN